MHEVKVTPRAADCTIIAFFKLNKQTDWQFTELPSKTSQL
jgi:hypothetical protein